MDDQDVITSLDQVTPAWLAEVLWECGALTGGHVTDLAWDTNSRNLSANARMRVGYSPAARRDCPQRLFLKMVDTDLEDEFFGPSEVHYYTRDYLEAAGVPLVRCYHAAYSDTLHRYHLLLEDHIETHTSGTETDTPLGLAHGLVLAEGLAAMHAHWWGRERLASGGEPIPDEDGIMPFVEVARPGMGHILGCCADELAPHWPAAIQEIFEKHPAAMLARTQNGSGFTLIHGDVYPGNILVPRSGVRPLYIIDRQPFNWSITTWLGAYDLAYAIGPRWQTADRRAHEQAILRHYLDHLEQRGVTGYSWGQLWDDYRLSMAMNVYVAVEWCRGGVNLEWKHIWLTLLQRTMTALDDLRSAELWQ